MQYNDDVKKRLKRAEGQVRGILRMMDEDNPCKDVVNQLSAVRSAVDKVIAYIVAMNLEQCVIQDQHVGDNASEMVKEAVDLLVKSKK